MALTLQNRKSQIAKRKLTSRASRTTSSFREQLRHHGPFLLQYVDGGIDFCAAEFVDRHLLHDTQFHAVATDRKRADESLVHPIAAVRAETDAMPVAGRCRFNDGADTVDDRVGRAAGARCPARFDDCRATLLD